MAGEFACTPNPGVGNASTRRPRARSAWHQLTGREPSPLLDNAARSRSVGVGYMELTGYAAALQGLQGEQSASGKPTFEFTTLSDFERLSPSSCLSKTHPSMKILRPALLLALAVFVGTAPSRAELPPGANLLPYEIHNTASGKEYCQMCAYAETPSHGSRLR